MSHGTSNASGSITRNLDWDDVRVFIGIGEAGSLAGASRRLRLSRATIWRRIQSLEHALRQRLFVRRPSGYVLTPAGVRLLERLGAVNRTIETACFPPGDDAPDIEGEVRVAAPEFLAAVLPEPLAALHRRHPNLVVEVVTTSPLVGTVGRDVDIALRVERTQTAGLALESVLPLPFGLFAAESYLRERGAPSAIDACEGHQVIAFGHALGQVAPEPWRSSGGRGARVVFRSNNPFARRGACRVGLGLAVLPIDFAREEPDLRMVFASDRVGQLGLHVYVSIDLRREPRVAAVRDALAACLKTRFAAAETSSAAPPGPP